MTDAFAAGDLFLLNQARLLERRVFAARFLGQPAAHVVDALRGYQNDDGGFGHALEPDIRCPASLPIDVETAFQALTAAGVGAAGTGAAGTSVAGTSVAGTSVAEAGAADLVARAADFLARTAANAGADGAVPPAFPVIEAFPRAAHWTEWTYQPGLNPTAGLAGLLYRLGVDHPWRSAAAAYCWRTLEAGVVPGDAHSLAEALVFLENVPERERADAIAASLSQSFDEVAMLKLDPAADGYGLTPLDLAPQPDSRWRGLFTDKQIDGHLDALLAAQQADGGWPISWDPPGEAAVCEWRGIVTLRALQTLTAYGRLTPPPG